jgi:hypothetical protein
VLVFALLAMTVLAAPAFAQANNCLQDEYSLQQSQKLNCTANDVRVAAVSPNIKDLNGNVLGTGVCDTTNGPCCIQGSEISFLADFEIVTSSTSSRSNIGLYFASQGQANALTGTCVDNIISPQHTCPGTTNGTLCGSDNYHELDGSPTTDNCGDTSSTDNSSVFGAAAEGVTIEVNNFLCQPPKGSTQLVLPNCTSWQVPGKTLTCFSSPPSFPYNANAIPGSPSKCNCGTITLPITAVTPTANVTKACTTKNTSGLNTKCDAGNEGSTVTYTVTISNTTNVGGITIDQICDSAYGQIYPSTGTCKAGTVGTGTFVSCSTFDIPNPGSATCTFTAVQLELATVTNVATASGHSDVSPTSTWSGQSNSVEVDSEDAPSAATVTKGFVGTEAGCATVRYSVDVKNTSTADEVLTLSTLSDTAYGDITKLGGATPPTILGTTCGVATTSSGLGTLSTSSGAGVLPASLAVGGPDYQCQFDGQFCSALDNGGCITQVDSVSGTIVGDEKEGVTETENTLTVQECFIATVTSK